MPNDLIHTGKQFAGFASDLTDEEISRTIQLINNIRLRYSHKTNTPSNLEAMRDEVLTKLAEIGILAEFDPTPTLYGDPPIIDIQGKVAGDPMHKWGLDHEKKKFEVVKAKELDEDYRGQKEPYNKRKKGSSE